MSSNIIIIVFIVALAIALYFYLRFRKHEKQAGINESCRTGKYPLNFREFIKTSKLWLTIFAILAGGAAGFLYYYFEGCNSGSCSVTGNPYLSTIFGSVIGLFFINRPCKTC